MISGSIVWASIIRTFISPVPLFNGTDFFSKPFPNPALLREIPRIVNTSIFFDSVLINTSQACRQKICSCLGKVSN